MTVLKLKPTLHVVAPGRPPHNQRQPLSLLVARAQVRTAWWEAQGSHGTGQPHSAPWVNTSRATPLTSVSGTQALAASHVRRSSPGPGSLGAEEAHEPDVPSPRTLYKQALCPNMEYGGRGRPLQAVPCPPNKRHPRSSYKGDALRHVYFNGCELSGSRCFCHQTKRIISMAEVPQPHPRNGKRSGSQHAGARHGRPNRPGP